MARQDRRAERSEARRNARVAAKGARSPTEAYILKLAIEWGKARASDTLDPNFVLPDFDATLVAMRGRLRTIPGHETFEGWLHAMAGMVELDDLDRDDDMVEADAQLFAIGVRGRPDHVAGLLADRERLAALLAGLREAGLAHPNAHLALCARPVSPEAMAALGPCATRAMAMAFAYGFADGAAHLERLRPIEGRLAGLQATPVAPDGEPCDGTGDGTGAETVDACLVGLHVLVDDGWGEEPPEDWFASFAAPGGEGPYGQEAVEDLDSMIEDMLDSRELDQLDEGTRERVMELMAYQEAADEATDLADAAMEARWAAVVARLEPGLEAFAPDDPASTCGRLAIARLKAKVEAAWRANGVPPGTPASRSKVDFEGGACRVVLEYGTLSLGPWYVADPLWRRGGGRLLAYLDTLGDDATQVDGEEVGSEEVGIEGGATPVEDGGWSRPRPLAPDAGGFALLDGVPPPAPLPPGALGSVLRDAKRFLRADHDPAAPWDGHGFRPSRPPSDAELAAARAVLLDEVGRRRTQAFLTKVADVAGTTLARVVEPRRGPGGGKAARRAASIPRGSIRVRLFALALKGTTEDVGRALADDEAFGGLVRSFRNEGIACPRSTVVVLRRPLATSELATLGPERTAKAVSAFVGFMGKMAGEGASARAAHEGWLATMGFPTEPPSGEGGDLDGEGGSEGGSEGASGPREFALIGVRATDGDVHDNFDDWDQEDFLDPVIGYELGYERDDGVESDEGLGDEGLGDEGLGDEGLGDEERAKADPASAAPAWDGVSRDPEGVAMADDGWDDEEDHQGAERLYEVDTPWTAAIADLFGRHNVKVSIPWSPSRLASELARAALLREAARLAEADGMAPDQVVDVGGGLFHLRLDGVTVGSLALDHDPLQGDPALGATDALAN